MKRVALLVVAVAVVACADNDTGTTGTLSRVPDDTATTIVIGPDGSSSVVVVGPDGQTSTTTDESPPPDDGGGAAGVASDGPVGSFGGTILTREVVVELRVQAGAEPNGDSVDHLARVLGDVAAGPVSSSNGAAIAGGAKDWSADELRALGREGTPSSDGRAVIHLLFLHGTFQGQDGVLGAAVQGDTAAIFMDGIDDAATPLFGSVGIQSAVTTHEVGHLLGLVDLVLQTGRQDPEHPGHSNNKQSVMYWAVESSLIADVLTGGPPTEFDADDLADLAAIRRDG